MAPSVLDRSTAALTRWRDVVAATLPSFNATGTPSMVLGETATGGDGGCANLSNAFVSGFFWVDQLNRAGRLNYSAVFRQDLMGYGGIGVKSASRYALAGDPGWTGNGPDAPFPAPNPDFYTSLLWKRTMGRRVLAVSVTTSAAVPEGTFRAGAHCAGPTYPPGAVAVAFVNLAPAGSTGNVSLTVPLGGATREEFHLTPPEGEDVTSRRVALNGGAALMFPSPDLQPAVVKNGGAAVEVQPASYGFLVWPAAKAAACM